MLYMHRKQETLPSRTPNETHVLRLRRATLSFNIERINIEELRALQNAASVFPHCRVRTSYCVVMWNDHSMKWVIIARVYMSMTLPSYHKRVRGELLPSIFFSPAFFLQFKPYFTIFISRIITSLSDSEGVGMEGGNYDPITFHVALCHSTHSLSRYSRSSPAVFSRREANC